MVGHCITTIGSMGAAGWVKMLEEDSVLTNSELKISLIFLRIINEDSLHSF